MPLSTSNSEFETEYQTLDQSGRRGVALKTLIAVILVFGSVVWVFKMLADVMDINGRVETQLEYLSEMSTKDKDISKVMVFGSSQTQAGFEPLVFEEALKLQEIEALSYNYGMGNLNPGYQKYITRQIRDVFEREGQKLTLSLVEFTPFQATLVRDSFTKFTRDQNQAMLLTPQDIWDITLEDPTRGILLFNIRYLRNNLSAELFSSILSIIGGVLSQSFNPDYSEARNFQNQMQQNFQDSLGEGQFIPDTDGWHINLRGGRLDKSDFSRQTMDALGAWQKAYQAQAYMMADLTRRVDQADILELGFDEQLIIDFIQMVKDLKAVSEHTEVILLPRNTDWIIYSPEVKAKLQGVLDRIERETGVPVRNFQEDPRITPAQFRDTTHLNFYDGIDIFSKLLADVYSDSLKASQN
jgi:hypothetical protein